MADRSGIFAGDDPFALTQAWMDEAAATEPNDPNAMALATADADGVPNVRIVLLKEIEDAAFVFYTNYDSAKGQEMQTTGHAAINLHWKTLGRQIRARGAVEQISRAQSDAYYRSRPLESRIGAWASRQSKPLGSRETLEAQVAEARRTHGDNPALPPHWGGFRLMPLQIEFWADGPGRLHDRFLWRRPDVTAPWEIGRLNP